ncbi:CDP-diacylglycerol--serine O-phosphatidyltransferase [Chitinimonas sp. PSY-7]|uniref:CDP-diacylglycerol--serine O-phosphatidyltransferase n=1 Tax=Chitinimonas sp. PSY-7 TaxID=3459088 RepID=UPI00404013F1
MHPSNKRRSSLRHQSIYLLPNSFTLAALFAGFYAIVQAMNHHFDYAAIAIFVAMVLDGMDGRVARMTHTQSAFGAEFDSLADMVSFGVAPALVSYEWMLRGLGKLGWIVAFIYCAGAALRLARFNTQLEVADKRFFQGMPSPTAAALVAGFVWLSLEMEWAEPYMRWVTLGITAFAGLTMVSNVRYYSFKEFNIRKTIPFFLLLPILFVFVAIAASPPVALFGLFVVYALSGYVFAGWTYLRRKPTMPTNQP